MIRKILAVSLVTCILSTGAFAAVTKVANDPTRISVGARILGMGKAYVGLADDMGSIFLNPAGLSNIENLQLTSMQGKFINEVDYLNAAVAIPMAFGNIGIGYTGSNISFTGPAATTEVVDGIRIIPSSTEGVSFGYGNNALLFSYGAALRDIPNEFFNNTYLSRVSLGATLKLLSQELTGPGISGGTASGYEIDLGGTYRLSHFAQLGMTLQNALPFSMGGKIHWASNVDESLPALLKTGLSLHLLGEGGLRYAGDSELKLNIDYDVAPTRPEIPNLLHAGLEWSPIELLILRAGIDQDYVGKGGGLLEAANNLTAGVGVLANGFRFDYAYHQYYALSENDTHYFSLSYGLWAEPLPPPEAPTFIKIMNPADKTITYKESLQILGKIMNKKVDKVTINNYEITLDEMGNFEGEVAIDLGKNLIEVIALSKSGSPLEVNKVRILRLITFKDIDPTYWAKSSVEEMATLGLIKGYPDGKFKPYSGITRAEFLTLLTRIVGGEPPESIEEPFRDVPLLAWYAPYIDYGVSQGYARGYPDGKFKPNKRITRAEGVVIISRFSGFETPSVLERPFMDVPGRHWAVKDITAAKVNGLLAYMEGKPFEPNKLLTRGETTRILSKTPQGSKKIAELLDWESGY